MERERGGGKELEFEIKKEYMYFFYILKVM
jgi:hypothetical protein